MSAYGLIQDGRLADLIRKRLNTSPGFSTLTPELMPVMVVQGDEPDMQWAKGVKLCAAGGEAVAGATNALGSLFNPANSGLIVTVESFAISTEIADRVFMSIGFAAVGANTMAEVARDTRWISGTTLGRAAAQVTAGTGAPLGVGDLLSEFTTQQLVRLVWEHPVVLRPGTALRFSVETAGTDVNTFTFMWRERPANPGELV